MTNFLPDRTPGAGILPGKFDLPAIALLIAAGMAANYFKYSIFLNIDFVFGSIFAMLALQFFGLARGVVAGALIASITYFLWGHPYAALVMTAEVAVVGWLGTRRKTGMVLSDAIFWVVVGMPMYYVLYHYVLSVPLNGTAIVMVKSTTNGIANALLARLIFTAIAFKSRTAQISYRDLVNNLLIFFALIPALILLAVESSKDFSETDAKIRAELHQNSLNLTHHLQMWGQARIQPVANLAAMASSRTPRQLQVHLDQARLSDSNFQRIGLTDKSGMTAAFSPLVDELGQSNIGRNFANRPYIPVLKQTLKPMLSEVVMSRVGSPTPIVIALAPVVISGAYDGYVSGILSLDAVKNYLDTSLADDTTLYTLLDKNDNVILSNRPDRKIMAPIVRNDGTLLDLDGRIYQWIPRPPPNTPIMERWKSTYYVIQSSLTGVAEWKLLLEQPVAPFQSLLYARYTAALLYVFLMLLAALVLAQVMSRRITATNEELCELTKYLPAIVESEEEPAWPKTKFRESNGLIDSFKEMARRLTAQVHRNRELNAALARQVEELEAFSYTVAHDLRTPVRAINGFSELVFETNKDKLDGKSVGYLKRVVDGGHRMAALIDDLLSLARLSRHQMNRRDINLTEMAKAVIAILAAAQPERSVETRIQEGMSVNADEGLLRAVLENLLGNAWKFTAKSAPAQVDIHTEWHDGRLTYVIRDNGAGFDIKHLHKLFQPFQRLHHRDEFEGTGIGLATVKKIIERHGGKVWIEGAVNAGATVYFTVGESV